jgi:hypothetical protein
LIAINKKRTGVSQINTHTHTNTHIYTHTKKFVKEKLYSSVFRVFLGYYCEQNQFYSMFSYKNFLTSLWALIKLSLNFGTIK